MTPFDTSVYPDCDPPANFDDWADRADYIQRVVGAFDMGLVPDAATRDLLRQWKAEFDRFPLSGSPGYHALRSFFGWESVPRARSSTRATYEIEDAWEGRGDETAARV